MQNGNAELFNRLQQMMIAGMERNATPSAPAPCAWAELAQLAREFMPVLLAQYRAPANKDAELEIMRLKVELNRLTRQKRSKRKGLAMAKARFRNYSNLRRILRR